MPSISLHSPYNVYRGTITASASPQTVTINRKQRVPGEITQSGHSYQIQDFSVQDKSVKRNFSWQTGARLNGVKGRYYSIIKETYGFQIKFTLRKYPSNSFQQTKSFSAVEKQLLQPKSSIVSRTSNDSLFSRLNSENLSHRNE